MNSYPSLKGQVIVTGGCGYIGSQTVIELLKKTELEVISIDNLVNSHAEVVGRIEEITGKRIKNYQIDLKDLALVESVFEQEKNVIGIIHFAAYKSVPESVEKPLEYFDNNLNSTINLLKCCRKFNIDNFIFSSSCSVYGDNLPSPVTEDTEAGRDLKSPYAMTKKMGEEILENFSKSMDGFQAISLRYFNPVGADPSGKNGELPKTNFDNLVPRLIYTALGRFPKFMVYGTDYDTRDGSCIRDYIHVVDIADAHIMALDYLVTKKSNKSHDIINLGSGKGTTVLEAITCFEKTSGIKLNYELGGRRAGDVAVIYSDYSKARTVLGWEPQYNIDQMMESAWQWTNNALEVKN
ncbi:MAG: UDP-glucose 4-epimerase GalE [Bacteroidota bacterium]